MVSFELSDEQREIRDWVHDFAEKEIRPVAVQYDEAEEFPWPVVKKAAEVGLYGVDFLQQTYGDATGIMPALVAEELTWGCAGIALAIQGTGLPVAAIFGQGTPASGNAQGRSQALRLTVDTMTQRGVFSCSKTGTFKY